MSMSDYQYERLCYLLKSQELSLSELQMLYDILSHDWASEDRVVQWLLSWLRKKPVKDTRR
jgi:DNA-binding response OmpR family regulator